MALESGTGDAFLTTGEKQFLEKLIAHKNDGDEERFHCWVRKSKRGKIFERLLLVSKYRVWSVKKGKFGKKTVQREGHLLELRTITLDRPNHAKLAWEGWYVEFQTDLVPQLLLAVRTALQEITAGAPGVLLPALEVTDTCAGQLLELPTPPQAADKIFEYAYRAHCNLAGIAAHEPLIRDISSLVTAGDRVLDMGALSSVTSSSKGGKCPFDLATAARALRHDRHFLSIILRDLPWKDAVTCFADTMRYNCTVSRLALTNVAAHEGFSALGEALEANTQHHVVELELSGNKIGNEAPVLSLALQKAPHGLTRLLLNQCDLNAKHSVVLMAALKESGKCANTLEELAISRNELGVAASSSLGALLRSASAQQARLHRLIASSAAVDVSEVCNGLGAGLANCLREVDLSFNRVDVRGAQAVGGVLSACKSLRVVCLRGIKLRLDGFSAMLRAAGGVSGALPHLDLSQNELVHGGSKQVAELAQLIASSNSLYSLDLGQNHIKNSYLTNLIRDGFLRCAPLKRIYIGCNGTKGSKWKVLVVALQELIARDSLEALSLAGDGSRYVYGEKLAELFPALEQSKLLYLNLSGNRMGEKTTLSLLSSLKRNQSLLELHIDGNAMGMSGLSGLKDAVYGGSSKLCHVSQPVDDIQRMLTACKSRERDGVKANIDDAWNAIVSRCTSNRESCAHYEEGMFDTEIRCSSDSTVVHSDDVFEGEEGGMGHSYGGGAPAAALPGGDGGEGSAYGYGSNGGDQPPPPLPRTSDAASPPPTRPYGYTNLAPPPAPRDEAVSPPQTRPFGYSNAGAPPLPASRAGTISPNQGTPPVPVSPRRETTSPTPTQPRGPLIPTTSIRSHTNPSPPSRGRPISPAIGGRGRGHLGLSRNASFGGTGAGPVPAPRRRPTPNQDSRGGASRGRGGRGGGVRGRGGPPPLQPSYSFSSASNVRNRPTPAPRSGTVSTRGGRGRGGSPTPVPRRNFAEERMSSDQLPPVPVGSTEFYESVPPPLPPARD